MTILFKGHHADRISMTYKSEDYRLQTYNLCQKGYTYQIIMWNNIVSKKHLAKILSPLDASFMDLFDAIDGKHQQCAMDNIYNSAIFFKAAYNSGKITDSWC